LDENLAQRRELAYFYDQRFGDAPVRLLKRPDDAILWRYPLLVAKQDRNRVLESLWSEGLFAATRWYPSLQAMHNALAPDLPIAATPAADQLADEIINLPLDYETAAKAIQIILDAL
jgi:dTDP-4-amino-4,6-dideoxygalactose transaminase